MRTLRAPHPRLEIQRAGAEWYACTKPDAEPREMPAALGVTL